MKYKIALLSDTHSYIDESVREICKECDEIWHAGDIGSLEVTQELSKLAKLRAVYGNIDGRDLRMMFKKDEVFVLGGLKIWMTHIGGYPPNFPPHVIVGFRKFNPDVFICGHSHILRVMFDENYNVLCMNPGAFGRVGFHQIRTMLRFEIEASELKNTEIIELGMRSARHSSVQNV